MMKFHILFTAVALCAAAVCASAADVEQAAETSEAVVSKKKRNSEILDNLKSNIKFYGFIRNYMPFDTRDSNAGSGDLFYWVPKDNNWNEDHTQDLNEHPQFRILALTSRVGVDIAGYRIGDNSFGAKIEADFFAGLSGSTGTAQVRLRQAYVTVNWLNPDNTRYSINFKAGQAWHPMAADLPDVFVLDSGMPFGPFSRTPQMTADFNLGGNITLTGSMLWQMQYTSMGPSGSSADYIKYGMVPEFYAGISYHNAGFIARLGVDVTTIRPRWQGKVDGVTVRVKDRETSALIFAYLQYSKGLLRLKGKTTFGGSGEHLNLMSGYAVSSISDDNSLWEYTPIRTSSSWVTVSYGQKVQGSILLGYVKNLGTAKDIVSVKGNESEGDSQYIYFQKNGSANINQMIRIEPELAYNVGRFTIGLGYMMSAVQYGGKKEGATSIAYNRRALALDDLHWVVNHRIEGMIRFTF